MTEKITTERETLERETIELVAVIGRLKREVIAMQERGVREIEEAYATIDRYLRNNLCDSDYAEVSKALEVLYAAKIMNDAKDAVQPTHASMPLTDEQILDLAEPLGAFACTVLAADRRIAFARAVLAAAGGNP